MLVRDLGDAWQLVRQPDHADLSGQLASAWGGGIAELRRPRLGPPGRHRATTTAGASTTVDRRSIRSASARPAFLDVPIPSHLAFYRACIEVVTERGSVRRPARLDARCGHLQRTLRDATGPALSRASTSYRGPGRGVRREQEDTSRGARRRPRRRRERSAGRTTSCSSSTTGSRSTSASGTARRARRTRSSRCRSATTADGRRASSRAARAVARRDRSVPVRRRARSGSRSFATSLPKRAYAGERRLPARLLLADASETVEITVERR